MEDEEERRTIINKHVAMLQEMADENVDGLYEMMERLAQGNPRLNKSERGLLTGFINVLIQAMGVYSRQIEDSNTMWNQQKEQIKLMKRQEKLMLELIRHRNWDALVEFERRWGE